MDCGGVIRKTCKRYNVPWDAHALTFSCYRGRAFLARDRTRRYVAAALLSARRRHRFALWAYVIMPEHVHLLILPEEETYSVSAILRAIKQSAARRAVAYLRKFNPSGLRLLATGQKHTPYRFWQAGGGHDRNIRSRRGLINMFDYIHGNPVRRGLVERAEEWYWSSYRDWEGLGTGPVPIDRESFNRSVT